MCVYQYVRMYFHTHTQSYAELLEVQLSDSCGSHRATLGENLSSTDLDLMSEQQLGQLLELKKETSKPMQEDSGNTSHSVNIKPS